MQEREKDKERERACRGIWKIIEIMREIKRRNRRERKDDAAEERRINGNRGKRKKMEDVKKRG